MSIPTDEARLAFALDLLDPTTRVRIRAELLSHGLPLRQAAAAPPLRPVTWCVPPPGAGLGLTATARGGRSLAPSEPGGRFELHLPELTDGAGRWILVLRRVDEVWHVVFPHRPEDRLHPTELRREKGGRVLDMAAGPEVGVQHWAVALPGLELLPRWSEDEAVRYVAVQQALEAGQVPVGRVAVEVLA